jgi:hypothetical protein
MLLLGSVRLILLHACQGGMVSEAGLLTGIAPALSAAGVPIVIAMQQSIRITAATRASHIIYRALAQEQSIQHAVNQARQALYIEEDEQVSWFVPTLYIRSRNTGPAYLLTPTSAAASSPPSTPPPAPEPAPVQQSVPAPGDEQLESLRKQLADAETSLRLIEERMAEYVMSTDIPLNLIKEERALRERITTLKARIEAGG